MKVITSFMMIYNMSLKIGIIVQKVKIGDFIMRDRQVLIPKSMLIVLKKFQKVLMTLVMVIMILLRQLYINMMDLFLELQMRKKLSGLFRNVVIILELSLENKREKKIELSKRPLKLEEIQKLRVQKKTL